MTAKADLSKRPPFGRLTALRPAPPVKGRAAWLCRCSCGVEKVVPAVYLTTGDTQSCGCLHRDLAAAKGRAKGADLAGQPFGRLRVLRRAGANAKGEILWLCRCSCGAEKPVRGVALLRPNGTRSCGCLRDELRRKRAAAVGAARRPKACRSCGRAYTAVGPQKECSAACRRWWHAADEAARRSAAAAGPQAAAVAALTGTLEARLSDDRPEPDRRPDRPSD